MGLNKSKMAKMKPQISKFQSMRYLKELLKQENINPNLEIIMDGIAATPLWFAVTCEEKHLTELFLSTGAGINKPCGSLLSTPLHIAAYRHSIDLVRLLLDHGAKPDVLDKWNYSPLMYVANYHDPSVVKELFSIMISCGCDVNFGAVLNTNGTIVQGANTLDLPLLSNKWTDKNFVSYTREPIGPISGTALHLAVQNPHIPTECVELLIDAGASINKANLNGQTPLMCVMFDVYYDYHSNVRNHAELLLSKTASAKDLNVQDLRGWTSFHYAAQLGNISCLELLLKAGCDCNVDGLKGETPLWLLLIYGWREAARYLLINGCDIDHSIDTTTILQMNQDVDICRHGKVLPIEFAISNKYYCLAKLMLQLGCKIESGSYLSSVLSSNISETEKQKQFMGYAMDQISSRSQMQPLYNLCRTVIRRTFKQALHIKCQAFGLPKPVQDFVCFKE